MQEGIYDKFVKAFHETVKGHKIGDPFEEGTFQGPQVTDVQHKRVMEYIEAGKSEGATLLHGGSAMKRDGYYIEPTIFTDVKENMRIVKEEIFGPVVAIKSFKDEDQVVREANNTSYGLAASVFTQDITKAHRVAGRLQAGMVWINSAGDSHYAIPFGGYKSSGMAIKNPLSHTQVSVESSESTPCKHTHKPKLSMSIWAPDCDLYREIQHRSHFE